jgi:hypothetical protein
MVSSDGTTKMFKTYAHNIQAYSFTCASVHVQHSRVDGSGEKSKTILKNF